MLKKYTYLLLIPLSVILMLSLVQPVFALEVDYPNLASAPTIGAGSDIFSYAQYIFWLLISAAGIIGVVSIAISAVRILVTAGSPVSVSDAKDRIFGAILGIVLLLTSVIILRTINPEIIGGSGLGSGIQAESVWYVGEDPDNDGGLVYLQAPDAEIDTDRIPEPYTDLFYWCGWPIDPSAKTLLVTTYLRRNFVIGNQNGDGTATDTFEMNCSDTIPIKGVAGSFKAVYKKPGVYFYLNDSCSGVSTPVQTTSGNIPPFNLTPGGAAIDRQIKSLKIVNGNDPRSVYGVILNKAYGFTGMCSFPIFIGGLPSVTPPQQPNDERCILSSGLKEVSEANQDFTDPKSFYLLNYDANYASRPSVGEGVALFSKDWSAFLGQNHPHFSYRIGQGRLFYRPDQLLWPTTGGVFGIGKRETPNYGPDNTREESYADLTGGGSSFFEGIVESLTFGLVDFSEDNPKQCKDPNRECIRKIEHKGLYYSVLYWKNPVVSYEAVQNSICQVNRGGITNLSTTIGAQHSRVLEAIYIAPTTP